MTVGRDAFYIPTHRGEAAMDGAPGGLCRVRKNGLRVARMPQGLKPLLSCSFERPKAEALGYLEASASAEADPYG